MWKNEFCMLKVCARVAKGMEIQFVFVAIDETDWRFIFENGINKTLIFF